MTSINYVLKVRMCVWRVSSGRLTHGKGKKQLLMSVLLLMGDDEIKGSAYENIF